MLEFLYSADVQLLQLINLFFHSNVLDTMMLSISYLGLISLWIIVAVLLYLFGDDRAKKVSKILFITLIVSFIITYAIKYIVLRPRPYDVLSNLVLLTSENDPSFPSGHSVTAMVAAYVLYSGYKNKLLFIIPLLVGLSRLYLGVHYPSDVLFGLILGYLIAYFTSYLLEKNKLMLK